MIPYDVIVPSVHDRRDLLDRTLRSMMVALDQKPARILVHEDARKDMPVVEGATEAILAKIESEFEVPIVFKTTRPGKGHARANEWLLSTADTDLVFYTQEDFDFLRAVPIGRCLEIMTEYQMNQVRFNKRKTMAVKGAHRPIGERWTKKEVTFGDQVFCISDRWYHQAAVWRRSFALRAYSAVIMTSNETIISHCEDKVDHWINQKIGGGCGSVDGDQPARLNKVRTFIWGGVGEPAFVKHTGDQRRTQGWG